MGLRTYLVAVLLINAALAGCAADDQEGPRDGTNQDDSIGQEPGSDQDSEETSGYTACSWADNASACKEFNLDFDLTGMGFSWSPDGSHLLISGGDPSADDSSAEQDGRAVYASADLEEVWSRRIELPASNPVIRFLGNQGNLATLSGDNFLTLDSDNSVTFSHRFSTLTWDYWPSPVSPHVLVEIGEGNEVNMALVNASAGTVRTVELGEDWATDADPDSTIFVNGGDRIVTSVMRVNSYGEPSDCYWLDIDTVNGTVDFPSRPCDHEVRFPLSDSTFVGQGEEKVILFDETLSPVKEVRVSDLDDVRMFAEDRILAVSSTGSFEDTTYTTVLMDENLTRLKELDGRPVIPTYAASPRSSPCVGIGEDGHVTVVGRNGSEIGSVSGPDGSFMKVACSPAGDRFAALFHHSDTQVEVAVFERK